MKRKQNLILITIDALRADRFTAQTMPCLFDFAKKGYSFSTAISQGPYTRTAFCALMTSTYPNMFGGHYYLDKERVVIAEILNAQGWQTAAFGTNPYLSRTYGYNRGFDFFDDSLLPWKHYRNSFWTTVGNIFFRCIRRNRIYLNAAEINKKACSWLNRCHRPFFLWIHYMDVHEGERRKKSERKLWSELIHSDDPTAKKEDLERFIELYDKSVRYVDYHIGRFLGYLKDSGLLKTTLVVLTSDHGEAFLEHGRVGHPGQLYDELIHVPLIIVLPKSSDGCVLTAQVRSIDVVPTILDWLDIDVDEDFKGVSLLPLIQGMVFDHLDAVSEGGNYLYAIRTRNWKLIKNNKDLGIYELFNLIEDPLEKNNLAEFKPNVLQQLAAKLKRHIEETYGNSDTQVGEIDPRFDVKRRLRGLGYL